MPKQVPKGWKWGSLEMILDTSSEKFGRTEKEKAKDRKFNYRIPRNQVTLEPRKG